MRKCKIGLVLAYKIPYHCSVVNTLYSLFQEPTVSQDYKVVIYDTAFEQGLMSDQITEMVKKCDVIVSIGQGFTRFLRDELERLGREDFPVFFGGITDPVSLGFVKTLQASQTNMTGAIRQPGTFMEPATYLSMFASQISSVFVPYAPFGEEGRLPEYVMAMKKILARAGITMDAREIRTTDENIYLAKTVGINNDAVLFMEGCLASEAISEVSRICFDNDILLFGEGLEAINKGAACAYGGDLRPIAESLFQQVREFWEDHKQPHQIPVTVLPNNRHFIMNEPRMLQCGIPRELVHKIAKEDETVELIRKWVNAPA